MNYELIKSADFCGTQCDIYSDESNEMFMTAFQLGSCLKYSDPIRNINKLVSRNKYLENTEFSVVVKLTTTDGKQYDTRIFTEDGIYEVTMLAKTEKAKEFRAFVRKLIKSIRKGEQQTPDYSALSPQLQFMIQMEQRQNALETAVKSANKRIEDMCETMQVRGDNWRKKAHALVNRIASATESEPKDIYLDIYEELEYRAGCNLSVRFDNLYDRLYERGVSQSRLDRLNHIDVIADDKRLTEIYIAIIKEMAVKYCGGI